jgi:hypothetical protein
MLELKCDYSSYKKISYIKIERINTMYKITLCVFLALNFSLQAMNDGDKINKTLKSIKEIWAQEEQFCATASAKRQDQFLQRRQEDVHTIKQLKQEFTGPALFERLNMMHKDIQRSYAKRMPKVPKLTGNSFKDGQRYNLTDDQMLKIQQIFASQESDLKPLIQQWCPFDASSCKPDELPKIEEYRKGLLLQSQSPVIASKASHSVAKHTNKKKLQAHSSIIVRK